MVPLLSQCILLCLELLLNGDRGQVWKDNSLTVISAQFLTTVGPYVNSPLSSHWPVFHYRPMGFPFSFLFAVLFPASTALLAPFSASCEHSIGAIGLGDDSILISVRRWAHICGLLAQSPHCLPVVQTKHEPALFSSIQLKHPGFDAFHWQWQALSSSTQHILWYFYRCFVWCGLQSPEVHPLVLPEAVLERSEKFLGAALEDLPPPWREVWGDFPASAGVHLLKGTLLNHPCLRWLTPKAHKSTSEEQSCLYLKCTEISHVWGLGGQESWGEFPLGTLTQDPQLRWQHISSDTNTTSHVIICTQSMFCKISYSVLSTPTLIRHGWILRCQVPFWTLKWGPSSQGRIVCASCLLKCLQHRRKFK